MTKSKSLTTGIAAAALVATIGLAYAQTSSESTTPAPDAKTLEQTQAPAATPGTTTPSTTDSASTMQQPSTTTAPADSSTSSTVTPPADSAAPSSTMTDTELAPRADRN